MKSSQRDRLFLPSRHHQHVPFLFGGLFESLSRLLLYLRSFSGASYFAFSLFRRGELSFLDRCFKANSTKLSRKFYSFCNQVPQFFQYFFTPLHSNSHLSNPSSILSSPSHNYLSRHFHLNVENFPCQTLADVTDALNVR